MLKIILIAIFGYVLPRLFLHLAYKEKASKTLKYVCILAVTAYAFAGIAFFTWPSLISSAAFALLVLIAILDQVSGWMKLLHKRMQKAKTDVNQAAQSDKTWDEPGIMRLSKELINHYRTDWQHKDFEAISHYTTERFSYHNRLFLEALNNHNRNVSSNTEIVDIAVVSARDAYDDEQDNFSLYVTTRQELELTDAETEKVILQTAGDIEEVYEIEREDTAWKLSARTIANKGVPIVYEPYNNYAHSKGFYYNNHSSSLLLPYDDRLSFNSFTDSGHMIIGVHDNLLLSIFLVQTTSGNHYSVATTTLPGKFPHILIRHREVTELPTDKLHRVNLDWPEFMESYELFVSEKETEKILISLLSPELIKYLVALPGPISIEMLERSVYIIFGADEEKLKVVPEILVQFHRRSLISIATKALLNTPD